MTGRVDRLTRGDRVSLWGLSTRVTSVIQVLTGVIGGSGDRDHILDQGCVYHHASYFAPCFGDERNRYDAGLSCSPINTETRIEALYKSLLSLCGKD